MNKNSIAVFFFAALFCATYAYSQSSEKKPHIKVRGIYGGSPLSSDSSAKLADYGVNAIFLHSRSIKPEMVTLARSQGASIYAEFNTMHFKQFLEDHNDAYPIGTDGKVSPAPFDWQGVCPTHSGYRQNRMDEFRRLLVELDVDGIWLDYHHSHASWERAVPELPDTCFCDRCLRRFSTQMTVDLAHGPTSVKARALLTTYRASWVQWRCDIFTDWVREFREIIDDVKPSALLGTYHCPWSDEDFGGARIEKLAIDLKAQAEYIDVFSPMPYHARFGHVEDPEWISHQVKWLGEYLKIKGVSRERNKIWPIVQLSDWGETVTPGQIDTVMSHGTQTPATGVMVFAWGSLRKQPEKLQRLRQFYLSISP